MTFVDGVPGYATCPTFFNMAVGRAPTVAHFVEVGTMLGCCAQQIAKYIRSSGKQIQLTMVDTFDETQLETCVVRHIDGLTYPVWSRYGEHNFRRVFDYHARGRAHGEAPHNVVCCDSITAADAFMPKSLDFVFLDTQHTQEHVARELAAWYPRMRPGSLIGGKWADVFDGTFTLHKGVVGALTKMFGPDGWSRRETAWYKILDEDLK